MPRRFPRGGAITLHSSAARRLTTGTAKQRLRRVVTPYINDGQVNGAHRLYYNDVYYAGPKAGTTAYYVATEMYDASNPGVYISIYDLKNAYPLYGS